MVSPNTMVAALVVPFRDLLGVFVNWAVSIVLIHTVVLEFSTLTSDHAKWFCCRRRIRRDESPNTLRDYEQPTPIHWPLLTENDVQKLPIQRT